MKRTFLLIALLLVCSALLILSPAGAEELYSIYMDGAQLNVKPVVKDGIVYLPVEVLASQLQLSFEWNPGLNSVKINDRLVSALPYSSGGVVYLPVESIAQAINARVRWDGKNRRIEIQTQKTPSSLQGSTQPQEAINAGSSSSIAEVKPSGGTTALPRTPPVSVGLPPLSPGPLPQPPQVVGSAPSLQGQPMIQSPPMSQGGLPIATPSPPPSASREPATGPTSKIDRMQGNISSAIQKAGQLPLPYGQGMQSTTSSPPPGVKDYSYPSSSAYPGEKRQNTRDDPYVRSMYGPPTMPEGLQLPPGGPDYSSKVPKPQSPGELMVRSGYTSAGGFIPKQGRNAVFAVTVSNIEDVTTIKNYYKAHAGAKYVIIHLSQQNVSDKVQIYTGKFTIADGNNKIYEYQESLSNYWLVILKPGGLNFGYLVFEMPEDAIPTKLILHALNSEPLTVNLGGL
jgi:hypothetical protein